MKFNFKLTLETWLDGVAGRDTRSVERAATAEGDGTLLAKLYAKAVADLAGQLPGGVGTHEHLLASNDSHGWDQAVGEAIGCWGGFHTKSDCMRLVIDRGKLLEGWSHSVDTRARQLDAVLRESGDAVSVAANGLPDPGRSLSLPAAQPDTIPAAVIGTAERLARGVREILDMRIADLQESVRGRLPEVPGQHTAAVNRWMDEMALSTLEGVRAEVEAVFAPYGRRS